MKELTAFEIASVNGAGWLQNGLATVCGKIGNGIWTTTGDVLTVDLPVVGTFNMAEKIPDLGRNIGSGVGSAIGGIIEGGLGMIPLVGGLFSKIFGN